MKDSLITLTDPRSPAAEAFRTLRTNLIFSSLDRPLTTLAVTMARGGRKTILVDCDLRRPRQHEIFGAPDRPGLTSMILDPSGVDEPPLAATSVEGLSLLPAGPPPPHPPA